MKNLFHENSKTKILGLLSILVVLWSLIYFIPDIFVPTFNSVLGNVILFIMVLFLFLTNKVYVVLIGIITIVLLLILQLSKEGFTSDSEKTFLNIQNTINRQKIFDMNIINQQATQEELDYFNKNGLWPWSQEVIDLYSKSQESNPFVRSTSSEYIAYARKIYNEAAILRLLSYQTKEGQFLLNGVSVKNPKSVEELPNGFGEFVYNAGLMDDRTNDIIKCNLEKNDSDPQLERIIYTGKGGIFGEQTNTTEQVNYNDLEYIIPGFKFLGNPCNPCKSMANIPDYSCKYSINVKDKEVGVSNLWKYLWNS